MDFEGRFYDAFKELEKQERPKRVTQQDFATRVSLLANRVVRQEEAGRWIRGTARPDYEDLPAVAQVLGVRLMWLVWEFGERLPTRLADYATADEMAPHELEKVVEAVPRVKRKRGPRKA